MASAAEQIRAIQAKAMERTEEAVRLGLLGVGERTIEISVVGDPLLWKRAPPADYRPGRFISNWNFSRDDIDYTTTDRTDVRQVNGLAGASGPFVGHVSFISNSLPYAHALEWGHSSQAPAGFMSTLEIEAPDIAATAARRAAQ